jgi:RHS repeat-associated protein
VKTNFGCSGISEYGPYQQNLVTSIVTPEGTYTLDYEATPGYSGDVTGRLKSVNLPTGGTINYTYSGGSNGITCADGSAATLSRQTPDGTWTYAHTEAGTAWTTTITDPQSNQTVLNFQTIFETKRQVKDSGGTTLLTVDTCYNGATMPCTGTTIALPIARRTVRNTLQSGLQSKTDEYYNSQGLPTEVDDYAYGLSLVRKRLTSYASLGNNIYQMPSSITIQNSGGATVAQTTVGYDQTSVVTTSGTPQHGSVTGSRGNKTTVTYTAGGSSLSRTSTNFDTGMARTLTDVNGAPTTYNYPDATSTCGNAFPTSVTLPMGMSRSMSWNCNAGKAASTTDLNGRTTSYTYDSLFRVTQTSYPDGGSVTTNYTSATVRHVYTAISGGNTRHDQITLDGLGRTLTNSLASDPSGATQVDTTYNSVGRVSTVSNPYRSLNDPTYGKDTFTYDALGRTSAVSHQDGTSTHIYYGSAVAANGGNGTQLCAAGTYGTGDPTLYVDETGKKRQTWADALGRIIEVDEPDSGGSLTVNTCYKYDLLGNLTEVDQGAETRTYSYDALSRLTSETTPEAGTTNFYYTTAGGSYCSNDPQLVCRRTDARSITTTYAYDAGNRLTSVDYSDTTPNPDITYGYDSSSCLGLSTCYNTGRRTSMTDASGSTSWAYDPMGRVWRMQQPIGTVTKTTSYTYNLDGSVATVTYPSGRVITYSYNAAQQPVSAVDSGNSINYALNASYAPQGALASLLEGQSGGFGGITWSGSYNSRLLPTAFTATSTNGTALNLAFSYFANGNVSTVTNNRDTSRTQTLTYDNLNRLATGQSQATSGGNCWGQSFGYDRYANLTSISVAKCSAPSLSLSVNTQNRITNSGFTYDAAGNLTADGTYTYTWDAENHLKSVSGVTYTYDGDGRRVNKSTGKLYWYGSGGEVLAETDLSGNITAEFSYFAGQRIAWRDSSGNVYYIFADQLGSLRTMTNATGVIQKESDYYPYGTERQVTNTVDLNYRFAGMEYDSETTDYHTLFRQYAPNLGRWFSRDPERGCVKNPQGLNLYGYVSDNPTNLTDPLGLQTCTTFCYDPYYAIDFPNQCMGCPGALAGVDPCTDWYYATTHAECPGPGGGPINISFGCGGESSGGGTGTCTERTHLPGPIYGYPAGGDLCAGTDHPYFWWAWTCTGDYNCCLGKQGVASMQCEKEGGVGGGLVNNLLIPNYSATFMYANCCGRKPKRVNPPPSPTPRPRPRPR